MPVLLGVGVGVKEVRPYTQKESMIHLQQALSQLRWPRHPDIGVEWGRGWKALPRPGVLSTVIFKPLISSAASRFLLRLAFD